MAQVLALGVKKLPSLSDASARPTLALWSEIGASGGFEVGDALVLLFRSSLIRLNPLV